MKNYTFLLFPLLFLLSSCANESNSIKTNDLNGTWVCVDAGDKSDLLAKSAENPGAEIVFKANKMTFPILELEGLQKEQEFSVKNDELHCLNNKDLIFKVKDLNDKKMTLEFALKGHDFVLVMEKSK